MNSFSTRFADSAGTTSKYSACTSRASREGGIGCGVPIHSRSSATPAAVIP
ncbi:hypothetical protein [Lentzea waywayandensis]|uniref:hypothetical protein n=1 Tax=Lentzea waywayandensis TaxID=84724 RepID=UPI0015A615EC|nr:hypothetical protein [Lentzea waywayandensis]